MSRLLLWTAEKCTVRWKIETHFPFGNFTWSDLDQKCGLLFPPGGWGNIWLSYLKIVLHIISQPFRKMKRMLWKTTRRQLFKNATLDYCFFVKWNWSVLDKACVKISIWKIHLNFIIQKFKLNKTKFSEKENGVLQGETNLTRMLGCTRMYWVVLCCAGLHWAVFCCAVL